MIGRRGLRARLVAARAVVRTAPICPHEGSRAELAFALDPRSFSSARRLDRDGGDHERTAVSALASVELRSLGGGMRFASARARRGSRHAALAAASRRGDHPVARPLAGLGGGRPRCRRRSASAGWRAGAGAAAPPAGIVLGPWRGGRPARPATSTSTASPCAKQPRGPDAAAPRGARRRLRGGVEICTLGGPAFDGRGHMARQEHEAAGTSGPRDGASARRACVPSPRRGHRDAARRSRRGPQAGAPRRARRSRSPAQRHRRPDRVHLRRFLRRGRADGCRPASSRRAAARSRSSSLPSPRPCSGRQS